MRRSRFTHCKWFVIYLLYMPNGCYREESPATGNLLKHINTLRSKEELDRPLIVDDSLGLWLSVALFSYYIKWKKLHCTYYSKMNISERKRADLLFPMYVRATIKVGNFYNISSSLSPPSFKSLSQDEKRKRERKDIQRCNKLCGSQ